jgi:RNase P/RNase MRP subunit p29
MLKTYSAWLGRQVVLQIDAGESRVPLRGRVVDESTNALRFRLEGRWDVDIFKEMIVGVEADNCPALSPSTFGSGRSVPSAAHSRLLLSRSGLMLMHDWNRTWELWWSSHFSKQLCYRTIIWTGLAGSILFLSALQIGVSESRGLFMRVICGFLGLVLSAVSLGCGTWLFGESPTMQAQIIPYWSSSYASFRRWLRQPLKP